MAPVYPRQNLRQGLAWPLTSIEFQSEVYRSNGRCKRLHAMCPSDPCGDCAGLRHPHLGEVFTHFARWVIKLMVQLYPTIRGSGGTSTRHFVRMPESKSGRPTLPQLPCNITQDLRSPAPLGV
jgi:hypothetical protein